MGGRKALSHRAFTLNPHSPVSLSDLAGNSLVGVECTAHHPNSRGVAGILSVTAIPLYSVKKDLAVAT